MPVLKALDSSILVCYQVELVFSLFQEYMKCSYVRASRQLCDDDMKKNILSFLFEQDQAAWLAK